MIDHFSFDESSIKMSRKELIDLSSGDKLIESSIPHKNKFYIFYQSFSYSQRHLLNDFEA